MTLIIFILENPMENPKMDDDSPKTPPPTPGKVYVQREMQKIRGDQGVFFVCVDVCADVWENIAIV